MVWPGVALLLTTLAFNLLGDGLRDAFDPRGPGDPCTSNLGEGHMKGKRLLGIALAISGLSLLLVAAARPPRRARARRHGRGRHDDRRRLHRPAALVLRRDVEARGATACKLMNWPTRRARPVAVATPEVSQVAACLEGQQDLTFTIKKGFRFSNGKPVTAKSFADAFNRFANPRMQSTGVQFLDIVKGAQA
jgi:hypothetical protein